MSYQVLARKWRPKTFREMVGQEHVLKALINALDHNRLHHAYLFTGTRGVGKTTIARILAKCLNCHVGVSSVPCGQCSACSEINEGRFVDLIEVDAASRTKVEDTRELLENVQYAPTAGRYKVYLIDEVHMLSNSSFNALLKTLEEPPPHVKFLLATTDPQKLPATVLSRCLQFNLKNMSPERIVGHLQNVLQQEMVEFEDPALWQLGRAADGSMRDALSLTDQAIAFGSGSLGEQDVRQMLGTIDQHFVFDIVQSLIALDGSQVLAAVDQLSQFAPDYVGALEELLTLLHRIAIAQAVPDAVDNSFGDADKVSELAAKITSEDVQLFYQMGLVGRRDLPLAPDPRSGFEMVLLRMLAFKPTGIPEVSAVVLSNSGSVAAAPTESSPSMEAQPVKKPEAAAQSVTAAVPVASPVVAPVVKPEVKPEVKPVVEAVVDPVIPPQVKKPAPSVASAAIQAAKAQFNIDAKTNSVTSDNNASDVINVGVGKSAPHNNAEPAEQTTQSIEAVESPLASPPESGITVAENNPAASSIKKAVDIELSEAALTIDDLSAESWPALYPRLGFGGVVGNIAAHCVLIERQGDKLSLVLDENNASLYNDTYADRMQQHLSVTLNCPLSISIMVAQISSESPAMYRDRVKSDLKQQATRILQNDSNVRLLVESFGATLDLDSVTSLH